MSSPWLDFKDEVIVVAGGGSNIGLAVVEELCRHHTDFGFHSLIIIDIDEKRIASVCASFSSAFGLTNLHPYRCDATKSDDVLKVISAVVDKCGRIDCLINTIGWVNDIPFDKKPLEEIDKEVKINFMATVFLLKAVVPHMKEKKRGSVVSLSSDAGRMGEFGESVYSGAKAGVIALHKSLAREMGKFNMRFNVICPGLTIPKKEKETISTKASNTIWTNEMLSHFNEAAQQKAKQSYALKRLGTAEEVANAILFLASKKAAFITGQTLSVSGGYSML